MNAVERRMAIYAMICNQGLIPLMRLADEFNVSYRTIERDLLFLTLSYPIEIVRGRRGGVKLAEWFHPYSRSLSYEQLQCLRRIEPTLIPSERIIINSIIIQFSQH